MKPWAALAVLTACFAAGVALLRHMPVSSTAWLGLYAACVVAALWLWRGAAGNAPASAWLAGAALSALLASIFAGADFALDTLNGAHRAKAQVAQHLGGLELWFVLCPGAVAVALASAVRAWLRRPAAR